ncbi:hypothetical protein MTR67_001036, partial [Solanum verrucosum]
MNCAGKIVLIPQETLYLKYSRGFLLSCLCVLSAFPYSVIRKKDGKASASVLQVDKCNNLDNCVPAYSSLNCDNGLFFGCKSSYMRSAAIFNPNTKEVRLLPHPNEGIDKSWRDTQNIFACIPHLMPSICISGFIYEFALTDDISIAAFDVKSEKIKIIALWNAIELVSCYELIEVKGQ